MGGIEINLLVPLPDLALRFYLKSSYANRGVTKSWGERLSSWRGFHLQVTRVFSQRSHVLYLVSAGKEDWQKIPVALSSTPEVLLGWLLGFLYLSCLWLHFVCWPDWAEATFPQEDLMRSILILTARRFARCKFLIAGVEWRNARSMRRNCNNSISTKKISKSKFVKSWNLYTAAALFWLHRTVFLTKNAVSFLQKCPLINSVKKTNYVQKIEVLPSFVFALLHEEYVRSQHDVNLQAGKKTRTTTTENRPEHHGR